MTSGESDLVDVSGEIRRESESGKAVLFYDGSREVWLPKSLIEIEVKGRRLVEIAMPEWLAKEKGLL